MTPGDKSKIRPPAPQRDPERRVPVLNGTPPTTGARLTTLGDEAPVTKTRASFREDEFIKLVRQHGKHVVWRKALLCPCSSPETEQASLSCMHCNGGGYVYVDPHEIQAVMSMFDKRTSIYEKFGLWQEGQVQITVEPQFRLGYRDSLEMVDSVVPMNELLKKGDRRGRRSVLPPGVDSARFRMRSITKVMYLTASKEIIALEEGIDYDLMPIEGWLRWGRGSRKIPDGTQFTVHYDFHPIYVVLSWMHVTRDDLSGRKTPKGVVSRAISLPVQAMGKMLWLVDANTTPTFDPVVPGPSGLASVLPSG